MSQHEDYGEDAVELDDPSQTPSDEDVVVVTSTVAPYRESEPPSSNDYSPLNGLNPFELDALTTGNVNGHTSADESRHGSTHTAVPSQNDPNSDWNASNDLENDGGLANGLTNADANGDTNDDTNNHTMPSVTTVLSTNPIHNKTAAAAAMRKEFFHSEVVQSLEDLLSAWIDANMVQQMIRAHELRLGQETPRRDWALESLLLVGEVIGRLDTSGLHDQQVREARRIFRMMHGIDADDA